MAKTTSTGGFWARGVRIHDDNDIGDVAVEGALQQHLGPVQPPAAGRVCQLGAEEVILHAQAQLSCAAYTHRVGINKASHLLRVPCSRPARLPNGTHP